MSAEFRQSRRQNKRRVLPNSRELVNKFNSTSAPEVVPEYQDPLRIEWTETPQNPHAAPDFFVGEKALRLPENSKPRYHLRWPVRHGWLNESDYQSRSALERDFFQIIQDSIESELEIRRKRDLSQYSCVFIVPDLYEKSFVTTVLDQFTRDFSFQRTCFIQESTAASFGAGYSTACIVDVGAQKTSICCVEDGMCNEEARVNLKYGGYDVTETLVQMMLFDKFNYTEFNMVRRHDYLLAEELKLKHALLSDENINGYQDEIHVRVHGEQTRKYHYRIYDEGMLAAMGVFRPAIFNNQHKLDGRHKLIPPSADLYDGQRNDPLSAAQSTVATWVEQNIPRAVMIDAPSKPLKLPGTPAAVQPPPKSKANGLPLHLNGETEKTPRSSVAGTPVPEDAPTPNVAGEGGEGNDTDDTVGKQRDLIDRTVPVMPLHQAILTSIDQAAGVDEKRKRDLLGSIMLIGGGSKIPHLGLYLESRLRAALPQYPKEILVAPPPRELDPAVIVWKGGSVFGKLQQSNDSWIGRLEYDRLGSRVLSYKCIWHW